MKLSRKPCKIIGVSAGEFAITLLGPPTISGKFILLRDPEGSDVQLNAGAYTKKNWSEETIQALAKFIESAEQDALVDLFDDQGQEDSDQETKPPKDLSFPAVPILGGPKRGGS